MDERVDILTEKGVHTGRSCMKSEAHRKGYWHPCIHIWVYNSERSVLIQQRSSTKDTFPSKWDVSVAGHVGENEDPRMAAQRELHEEVGITCQRNELESVDYFASEFFHSNGIIDREYHFVYLIRKEIALEDLSYQEEEVNQAQWIPMTMMLEMSNPSVAAFDFVPYPQDYLKRIHDKILDRF